MLDALLRAYFVRFAMKNGHGSASAMRAAADLVAFVRGR
jgi:hypothetical protein